MLTFTGKGRTSTCDGVSRRDFLQVGTLGAIGFGLPEWFAARAAGAVEPGAADRACIMIFNLGAPSNMDLWDMKPDAPAEVRGPFKPIATTSPAIQFSEILPRHAQIADKISLVRSVHHSGAAVHDAGWQMMQTGRLFTGGVNTPHIGSVVSYLEGRKTDLPPFVVLPELMGRGGGNLPNGQAGGFLGKAHDPFSLNADPSQPGFRVPDLLPPKEIGNVRLDRRKKIRELVDDAVATFEASENAALLDGNFQSAFRLMTSTQAREAFDLAQETTTTRERYGMSRFGQCCLLARRLVESGVRFVTINAFLTVFDEITWDIHGSKPFTSIEGMRDIVCPMYDQAYTALIEDLAQRGACSTRRSCATWRSSAARRASTRPAGATTGRSASPSGSPAAASKGAALSGPAIRWAPSRPTDPSSRPTSPPRSSTASGSTSKPSSRAPPGGRSRWSISDTARSTSYSEWPRWCKQLFPLEVICMPVRRARHRLRLSSQSSRRTALGRRPAGRVSGRVRPLHAGEPADARSSRRSNMAKSGASAPAPSSGRRATPRSPRSPTALVTPVHDGQATITAKWSAQTATARVVVHRHERRVRVELSQSRRADPGETGLQLGCMPRRLGRQGRLQALAAGL